MAINSSGQRTPWRTILAAILAVLGLTFVIQNWATVNMKFLWATFRAPLWLMLIITLVVGVVIGLLVSHRHGKRAKPDQQ